MGEKFNSDESIMDDVEILREMFDKPIYSSMNITNSLLSGIFNLSMKKFSYDSFCIDCGKERTFHNSFNAFLKQSQGLVPDGGVAHLVKNKEKKQKVSNLNFNLKCTTNENHTVLKFTFVVKDDILTKYGQFPSYGDLNIKNESYFKLLDKQMVSEFNKAIGLAAHGVGIGAFVYLRRIFEKLIIEAKNEALSNLPEKFDTLRMDEKIPYLKDYLPSLLIENKRVYSILSKGLHELNEKTCLDLFPIVRGAIELILEEKETKINKEKREREIRSRISQVNFSE